jgi:hypothetical protein
MSTWPTHWKLVFLLTPWILLYVGLAITAGLAWSKKLETMLNALPSSEWLKLQVPIWRCFGLRGRYILTAMIAGLLTWPVKQLHIRKGKLNNEDVDNFPRNLKFQLLTGKYLTYLGGTLCIITTCVYRISKEG